MAIRPAARPTADVAEPGPDEAVDRRRHAMLRGRRWPVLSLPGAWGALVMVCASLTPSLLPRSGVMQGVLGAISAACGYGIGVLGAAMWRGLADRERRPVRPWAWRAWTAAAIGLVALFLALGWRWQEQLRRLMGAPLQPWWELPVSLAVGLAAFAVLLALGRAIRLATFALTRLLGHWLTPRAARTFGVLVVATAFVLLVGGVAGHRVLSAVDEAFAAADTGTPAGVHRPTSPDRSGSPQSLISWNSLGYYGRDFVARGPSADQIRAVDGTGMEPIRTFAGLATAADPEVRARRAVADLERAGGFQRSRLLVATTAGEGWLDLGAMSAFEYVAGGDSAIVSMQYSYAPSGVSYLVDQSQARTAGRDLFDAVYERWSELPRESRPRLYVFGESLGSFGGEAAFSGEQDLHNRTSGALFVGPPNFNPLDRSWRAEREPGTPEIEPVYRRGRTVRFTTDVARGAPPAAASWPAPRVLIVQHPSDPVTAWSPSLLFSRPDWLAEPRGRDVLPSMTWIPVVTFWQVTLDMPEGVSAPPGHGHHYTRESVDAWALVLEPANWSAAKAERIRTLVDE